MKEKSSQSEFIKNNSLFKVMLSLSIPGIMGMMMFGINAYVDAIFVGQLLGEEALAGISMAMPLTSITMGFGGLIGMGSSTVLSIAIGADDKRHQGRILGNLMMLSFIVSVILSIAGYIFADDLVAFMGGEGELLTIGSQYFKVLILGAFFSIFGISGNMLIRGEGKMKDAMIFASIAMISNMILDPIFISVFNWGIEGAAAATVAGMAIYSIINYVYFRSNKTSYDLDAKYIGIDKEIAKKIISIGSPSMLMSIMGIIQATIIFRSLSSLGTDSDIAFYGAVHRILMLSMIPVFGLVRSLQPVIGINFGAKQYDRVKQAVKIFILAGMALLTVIWLPTNLFPRTALGTMLPNFEFTDNQIFNFRLILSMLPVLPIVFMGITLFQSIGNGKLASFLTVARQLVFFIPAILIITSFYGVDGIYYSMFSVDMFLISVVVGLILYQFKKLDKLENETNLQTQTN